MVTTSRSVAGADEGAFFREHGWVVLRGVVPAAKALALGEELDRAFPEARLPSARVHERAGISALAPMFAEQVRDPALARRAAALLGCEQVQLLQDTALVKPATSTRAPSPSCSSTALLGGPR